jgi:2-C-methyl-D-erythritol 4-phosphate cytidylyltransferase
VRKSPFFSAIVVGGGAGKRFNHKKPKQFIQLGKKPVIVHSLEKFQKSRKVKEIVAVVPRGYLHHLQHKILPQFGLRKVAKIVVGGKTRQKSVRFALAAVDPRSDYILVHDAVRPLVRPEDIERLIIEVQNKKAVILAVPIKETVKKVQKGKIVSTLNREGLWLAQTPQAFETGLLKKAYLKAKKERFEGTDCASLVERLGINVDIVLGSYRNIKVTDREDLKLAEKLLG